MALLVVVILACLALTQAKLIDLSCKQIHKFVDGHNSRRLWLAKGQISDQPAASEMKYIVWDEELASKAGKWASRNQFAHNPDTSIGSRRFKTGENLYYYANTEKFGEIDPENALKDWFDEHYDFTYRPLKHSDFGRSKDIGHYTQMVWSDSTHLGCAVSQFTDNGWNKYIVVCNYGPAGNMINMTPYKSDGDAAGTLTCGVKHCSRRYGDRC